MIESGADEEPMPQPEIALLLEQLDHAFDRSSWHGPNLRGAIRGLGREEIAYRPQRERHNIWELVVHCAYWKYAATRQLTGEKRGAFPLAGSNFFPRPLPGTTPTESAWRADVKLLDSMHRALRAAVADLDVRELGRVITPRGRALREIVIGIAAHDLYHAGQIQLLKRLFRGRPGARRG